MTPSLQTTPIIPPNLPASSVNFANAFDYREAFTSLPERVDIHHPGDLNTGAAFHAASEMENRLIDLIKKGDNDGVKEVLKEPAACWLMKNFGSSTFSPMIVALQEKNFDAFSVLLKNTATVDKLNASVGGQSLATMVVSSGDPASVRLFVMAAKKMGDDQLITLFKPSLSLDTAFGKALDQYGDPRRGAEQKAKDLSIIDVLSTSVKNIFSGSNSNFLNDAIKKGCDAEVLRLFERAGADISHKDENGCSPMMHAAFSANFSALEYFITNLYPENLINLEKSHTTENLLFAAIEGGNDSKDKIAECVKLLIRNGMDVNFHPAQGKPLLFEAIARGNGPVVELLLNNSNAKREYINAEGKTISAKEDARRYASDDAEHLPMASHLLSKDEIASLSRKLEIREAKNKIDIFIISDTYEGRNAPPVNTLRTQLENLKDRGLLHEVLTDSFSLHEAALYASPGVVATLIDFVPKSVIHVKDENGNNALHFAAKKGNAIDIDALMKAGVSPSEKNNEGFTALMMATFSNAVEYIMTSLGKGSAQNGRPDFSIINLEDKNNNGKTVLDLAFANNKLRSAETLLKAGAKFSWSSLDKIENKDIQDNAKALMHRFKDNARGPEEY